MRLVERQARPSGQPAARPCQERLDDIGPTAAGRRRRGRPSAEPSGRRRARGARRRSGRQSRTAVGQWLPRPARAARPGTPRRAGRRRWWRPGGIQRSPAFSGRRSSAATARPASNEAGIPARASSAARRTSGDRGRRAGSPPGSPWPPPRPSAGSPPPPCARRGRGGGANRPAGPPSSRRRSAKAPRPASVVQRVLGRQVLAGGVEGAVGGQGDQGGDDVRLAPLDQRPLGLQPPELVLVREGLDELFRRRVVQVDRRRGAALLVDHAVDAAVRLVAQGGLVGVPLAGLEADGRGVVLDDVVVPVERPRRRRRGRSRRRSAPSTRRCWRTG